MKPTSLSLEQIQQIKKNFNSLVPLSKVSVLGLKNANEFYKMQQIQNENIKDINLLFEVLESITEKKDIKILKNDSKILISL